MRVKGKKKKEREKSYDIRSMCGSHFFSFLVEKITEWWVPNMWGLGNWGILSDEWQKLSKKWWVMVFLKTNNPWIPSLPESEGFHFMLGSVSFPRMTIKYLKFLCCHLLTCTFHNQKKKKSPIKLGYTRPIYLYMKWVSCFEQTENWFVLKYDLQIDITINVIGELW